MAASIRGTVLKDCKIIQMEKYTWVLTETLLEVQFPQQRSEMAILQCIELTSALEEY